MAGDEILMGQISALGPIDAQIMVSGKRFSADAFLDGLDKIKKEIDKTGRLNPAYIPILQNISPGEIQHCENAQEFSKILVSKWLAEYKFKYWEKHSSTGLSVTEKEKRNRAKEIAEKLCKHSDWLTHGRSINISDLEGMRLQITDYSKDKDLNEAITKYYTLLRMSFDTRIYKLFETIDSQIYRFLSPTITKKKSESKTDAVIIEFECPTCKNQFKIQANIKPSLPLKKGHLPFPIDNNIFKCPECGAESNISAIRLQIEADSGKKIAK